MHSIRRFSNGDGLHGHISGAIGVGDSKRGIVGARLLVGMPDGYTTADYVIPEVPCVAIENAIGVIGLGGIKSATQSLANTGKSGHWLFNY